MNLEAQSGLLAAIVCAAIAISVLLRGRRTTTNALFTVFSANLFVHFLAAFLHRLSGRSIWFQVDLIAAVLLPVTSFLFFGYFLWKEPKAVRPFLRSVYVASGLLVAFLFTPWSQHDIVSYLAIGYVFVCLYWCTYFVLVRYRELKSERERLRLRYLLVALLVAVSFALAGTLPPPLAILRSWGDLVTIFFLYFVGQSLLKYRLLDLQELLGRGLVLTAIALILALVFGVLLMWTGGAPELPMFHTFVASFVILILFEPLRDKLEGSSKLLLFRERYELSRKLEDLRREIANIIDPKQMIQVMLDILYDRMHMSHTSIYFQDEGGASYRLVGFRGFEPPGRVDVVANRAFFDQLKKTPTVIMSETFQRQLASQAALAESESSEDTKHAKLVLEVLSLLHAGVCVPLMGQKNEVLGLWNLYDETASEGYTTEEIARIMAVGEQAAIVVENSRMFAKVRERDRLAVLGQMAAGLAHEIRNPLGAIKGAAQYLDPAAVGEDAAEFLKIIIEETDRLNQVVNQFLDYARPLKAEHAATDINQVIQHTGKLMASVLDAKQSRLQLDLEENLPLVQANGQQLTQVLLNLLNNAVEAGSSGGVIGVRSIRSREGSSFWPGSPLRAGAVEIQVSDTGSGISPEAQERIFVPFFTTKEHGTGLGLAICQRIIENHSGEIRVRSKVGEGSTFTVFIPFASASDGPSAQRPEIPPVNASEKKIQEHLPFPGQHGRG